MKVAHIAPPWISIPPKNYGGTETVLYNLVEEQVAQGHDVTLFAPGDATTSAKLVSFFPQSLIDAGVPWQDHLKAYYHIHKAVEYVKDHNFDVVHTHLSSSSDMYVFPLMAHVLTPCITTLHSRFPFDRVGAWVGDADELYKEWFLSAPMVAISERALEDVSYPLNFIGVVHHGLPMALFKPTAKVPEDFFVWLGRLVPEKGAHLAAKAAKKANVPLVIAGIVDKNVPISVDYFEKEVRPLIDDQQIKFIGPIGLQEKIDLLSRARGLLNPIEWEEPFGMVMIEAMAVGCPVIAFVCGAAPEIVVHEKSGFLVHDLKEMIRFIPKIDTLDRVVVREYVVCNFSVQSMTEKYTKLYKKVIASSRKVTERVTVHAKVSGEYQKSHKMQRPLSTHRSALLKKDAPVQTLYQVSQTARAKQEAEPTP